MGPYSDVILPRPCDLAMRNERLRPYRERVIGAAEGRVLEVGVSSGLNLPFYRPAVREILGSRADAPQLKSLDPVATTGSSILTLRRNAMTSSRSESEVPPFTPAAGFHWLTPFYDFGVAVLTRESHWRNRLVAQVGPSPDDVIADLGCGTGSLLVKLGTAARGVKLIGIDPDPTVLDRARAKSGRAGVAVDQVQGFARDASSLLRGRAVTKIVSSLVFHQVPLTEKSAALGAAYEALSPGGELHIADYGLQRTMLMRRLFRATVQNLDGIENTEPQARGVLPELIRSAGFSEVVELEVVSTSTGSISLIRALRL